MYDTKADKKLAFKMGQRPFQSVVCEGVEEGLKVCTEGRNGGKGCDWGRTGGGWGWRWVESVA